MGSNSNAIAVLWSLCISICFVLKLCHAANTIRPGESMGQNETLVSAGGNFVLGFFNPDRSQNYYLGIWYNKASVKTIVWVANREKPVNNSSGVLQIRNDGNLVVSNGAGTYFWSSNVSVDVNSQTATLLDTGNLVLSKGEDENPEKFLWQSFDYPSDTLLPGMKLGLDRKTGLNRFLTSWRSRNDPSPGDFYYKLDPQGSPQLFILNGADRKYRSGPWIGYRFSGTPELNPHFVFNFTFINNQKEIYYIYSIPDISVISRLVLDQSGKLQRFRWNERNAGWDVLWENPKDICDKYEKCGSFGNCNSMRSPECSCLPGFEPKSPRNWFLRDFFDGCVRRTNLSCVTGDGFEVVKDVKLPDTSAAIVEKSLSLNDCETKCMNNCNCTAFANADIDGNGSGCLIWIGNLIDVRELPKVGQELHLRLAASELGKGNETKRVILIATLTVVSTVLFLSSITYYLWTRKAKPKAQDMKKSQELLLLDLRKNVAGAQEPSDASKVDDNGKNDLELWLLDLNGIAAATDNFSDGNKVGEGGFGPVYKGKLPDGQEIAVKRLSKRSGQGHEEFKTEVLLISKLQHRNLVRLLGCCIQAEEKILIYEYMPNKSLDLFLFDQTRSTLLDWGKRFNIILGIARGLLYLHQDSRLRIIHRDLKASNILLDGSMNPKIADFGMARIFQGNQTEVVTTRVVGTYGYMSPEYLMDGLFSEKSDVFSFGVLLLEIVCGKKNKMFDQSGHSHNLLGQVWNLWKEDRCLELIDPSMGGTYSTSEVLRSIQVGLLCVQEWTVDRPAMSSTILMLSSEAAPLPLPKQPAFFTRRTQTERDSSSNQYGSCSINEITVTLEDGR